MALRPWLLVSLGLLLACADATTETASMLDAPPDAETADMPDAAADDGAAPSGDAGTSGTDASSPDAVALGMNDVTILAPVPASADAALMRATDLMDDGTPLVPRALFDRLNEEPIEIFAPIVPPDAYEALQLVAVRFELCDRNRPEPCSETEDGRLRLVLQPYRSSQGVGGFDDVGLHAFFSIPAAEIPAVVRELRALARIQSAPPDAPLDVNPALAAGNAAYADALRALVRRIAGEQSFVRLTLNAQPSMAAAVRWVLRGVEMRDGALADVVIPGIAGSTEGVIKSGRTFTADPVSDTPAGMTEIMTERSFDAANDERKRELIAVLAAAENPNVNATDTVSCVACHLSTQLTYLRTTEAVADSIAGRYTSSYDLTVRGALRTANTLRALGWVRQEMIISRRVVNDTAQLLLELQTRFPP
jgi:hypothetical protein